MANNWAADLNKIIKRDKLSAEKFLRASVIQAANVAIVRSPVGAPETWKNPPPKSYPGGGSFRANWRISINSLNMSIKDTIDFSGVASDVANDVLIFSIGDTLTFSNPLPYGPRLEYDAWSSQRPDGMVRPAVVALKKALNKEANK